MTDITINTAEALKSLGVDLHEIREVAGSLQGYDTLEFYGIEPSDFYPEVKEFISQDEWIKILLYYAIDNGENELAEAKLIELGEI
jgi:hypothetical protein